MANGKLVNYKSWNQHESYISRYYGHDKRRTCGVPTTCTFDSVCFLVDESKNNAYTTYLQIFFREWHLSRCLTGEISNEFCLKTRLEKHSNKFFRKTPSSIVGSESTIAVEHTSGITKQQTVWKNYFNSVSSEKNEYEIWRITVTPNRLHFWGRKKLSLIQIWIEHNVAVLKTK